MGKCEPFSATKLGRLLVAQRFADILRDGMPLDHVLDEVEVDRDQGIRFRIIHRPPSTPDVWYWEEALIPGEDVRRIMGMPEPEKVMQDCLLSYRRRVLAFLQVRAKHAPKLAGEK